jgi:pimeloyl-ACP methyl ester carboxylesterase
MATFILVSGSWHAGWCWERIVPLLEAAGHKALAPDLLGMGADKTPLAAVTLAAWADQIATLIGAQAEPVILVGHSRGGIVISEAAERQPGRIRTLVYLAALLVPPGKSTMEVAAPIGQAMAAIAEFGPDGASTIRAEAAGPTFYNTTGPEWVERAIAHLCPEPMTVSMAPLSLTQERYGSVPRAYVECTEDRALSLAFQREMQAALPCSPVLTLETNHSPFYSNPEALAECLRKLAGE